MERGKKISVDEDKIRKAIQAGIPLTVTTYTLPHEMEEYMADVLHSFLQNLNQGQMTDTLSYCLKELTNNGKKANTKRIYFEEKNLDIFNPADYEQGMTTFKRDTLSHIDHYLGLQKKRGLFVKMTLQARKDKIILEVSNRSELTVFEYKRIHDKLTRALQYNSVEEGILQLLDDSEGAGLGLVMMALMLRKQGVSEENFLVVSGSGETHFRILVPFFDGLDKDIAFLSKEFVALVEGLPEFPENVALLGKMLDNPESKMSDIAHQISLDVSLTSELLKLVNSAAFSLATPCMNIGDAVKFAGLRGIRNLLYSIGSLQTLSQNANNKRELWKHSYQTAFYAYNLARTYCRSERTSIDDSFVCGLLHDMGKIVFETARPQLLEKISDLCHERNATPLFFERLVAGMNHSEIGALLADKWNFPPMISTVIRFHHNPFDAPAEAQKLTAIIYLADMLTHHSEGDVSLQQFDPNVLSLFDLNSLDDLRDLSHRLKALYIEGQKREKSFAK